LDHVVLPLEKQTEELGANVTELLSELQSAVRKRRLEALEAIATARQQ
jgi:hypothetical protein